MTTQDYIPTTDAELGDWLAHFVAPIVANPGAYGLSAADAATLQADQTAWTRDYPAHTQAETTSRAARQTKQETRAKVETDVRASVKKINATPAVTDAQRSTLGLKPHAAVRIAVAQPATRPIGRLEATGHATLTIHFTDAATPALKAKPHGIHGCEVWSHVGDPAPADPSGFAFIALDTRTPYVDEHPSADAGKSVQYMLRWQNTKGEHGPWSDVIVGKIPV